MHTETTSRALNQDSTECTCSLSTDICSHPAAGKRSVTHRKRDSLFPELKPAARASEDALGAGTELQSHLHPCGREHQHNCRKEKEK